MKKNYIIVTITFCLISIFCFGCSFFNQPLLDEFKEYTENVVITKHSLDYEFPIDCDGIISIPSDKSYSISFFLRNPQQYSLVPTCTFDSEVISDDYSLVQTDKSLVVLTLSQSLLLKNEDGTNLNPLLKVTHTATARTFEPYTIQLRCNSVPVQVRNATIYKDTSSNTYILCFTMPDLTGIHKDVTTLTINDKNFNIKPNESNYGLTSDFTFDFNNTWQQINAVFNGKDKDCEVYYCSNIPLQSEAYSFNITLTDSKGLTSSMVSVDASSRQLDKVTITPDLSSDLINNDNKAQITLQSNNPAATIHYTIINSTKTIKRSGTNTGSESIYIEPGKWTITAWASCPGFVDSEETSKDYSFFMGSNIYVKNDGNDNNLGTEDDPLATIQAAINKIKLMNDNTTLYNVYVIGDIIATAAENFTDNSLIDINLESTEEVLKLCISGYNNTIATINASNLGRLLNIGKNVSVIINNITLTGGKIDTNGAGVYVNEGTFTMSQGSTISGNNAYYGGGAYVDKGTFTMSQGSTISGNIAKNGGGVYIENESVFNMTDNATISNNIATNNGTISSGGGVYVYNESTFNMTDNATISNNEATFAGGGVYVLNSEFVMESGTIGGDNTKSNNANKGGGVYVDGSSTFTMKGGIISYNTANVDGSGVLLISFTPSFNISGSASIVENYVSLGRNTTIKILGKLSDEVTTVATIKPYEYTAASNVLTIDSSPDPNTTLKDEVKKFKLKDDQWIITNDGNIYPYISDTTTTIPTSGTVVCNSLAGLNKIASWVNDGHTLENVTINLLNDITLDNTYIPIGKGDTADFAFCGIFNGDNHTIYNLNLRDSTIDYPALFGCVKGTVKNLTVKGESKCAGLVGYLLKDGFIDTCINEVTINNSTMIAGGIVGYNNEGKVYNCINKGTIQGKEYAGGISGYSVGTIYDCINNGNVTSTDSSCGGIVGSYYSTSSSKYGIFNNINTGTVEGKYYTGGIVGEIDLTGDHCGYVAICYNRGDYLSRETGYRAGAIIGKILGNPTELNFYAVQNYIQDYSIDAYLDKIGDTITYEHEPTYVDFLREYAIGNNVPTDTSIAVFVLFTELYSTSIINLHNAWIINGDGRDVYSQSPNYKEWKVDEEGNVTFIDN